MDHLELLQRLAVALAIGLLIGIERGWTMLGEGQGERTAGLRTLALSGLLGGVSGALGTLVPGGAVVLAASFATYGAIIAAYRYREVEERKTYGTTTIVASLVAFGLGALAIVADPVVVAAAGVVATALLAMKSALHGWLRTLTWGELRAGLMLLAMSVILLPVLPDRGFGPLQALNPYDLWRMTILIAAVSSLGYLAMKWFGGDQGVALSGIAGGLVSSTAVTVSFSRLARLHPENEGPLVAGALLAGAVMMGRILLVTASIEPKLMVWLMAPLGLAGLVLAGMAAYHMRTGRSGTLAQPIEVSSPFELATVLKFGGFLAVVMVVAKVLTHFAGDSGAYALAAVSGIADVDAVTLSLSQLVGEGMSVGVAGAAILLAAGVNTVSKAVLAAMAGGRGPGRKMGLAAVGAIAGGVAGAALAQVWDPIEIYNQLRALPVGQH